MRRDPSIDTIKGIGIILVVLGHLPYFHSGVKAYIYTFHMPLFVVISGLFINTQLTLRETIINKINRLIKPFVIYFIVSWLVYLVVIFFKYPLLIQEQLYKIIYLFAGTGQTSVDVYNNGNVAIWFLPFLFFVTIADYTIHKYVVSTNIKLLITLCLTVIGYYLSKYNIVLPANIDVAFCLFPFCFIGRYYNHAKQYFSSHKLLLRSTIMAAILIHTYAFCVNGRVDTATATYGDNIVIFYLTSISAIFVVFFIFQFIDI